jgi:hypothetical protein
MSLVIVVLSLAITVAAWLDEIDTKLTSGDEALVMAGSTDSSKTSSIVALLLPCISSMTIS